LRAVAWLTLCHGQADDVPVLCASPLIPGKEMTMKPAAVVGAVLIVLGGAALVYKGFDYTSEETVLQVGSLKATAETEKSVAIPGWAGVAAIVVGVLMVGVGLRR